MQNIKKHGPTCFIIWWNTGTAPSTEMVSKARPRIPSKMPMACTNIEIEKQRGSELDHCRSAEAARAGCRTSRKTVIDIHSLSLTSLYAVRQPHGPMQAFANLI